LKMKILSRKIDRQQQSLIVAKEVPNQP